MNAVCADKIRLDWTRAAISERVFAPLKVNQIEKQSHTVIDLEYGKPIKNFVVFSLLSLWSTRASIGCPLSKTIDVKTKARWGTKWRQCSVIHSLTLVQYISNCFLIYFPQFWETPQYQRLGLALVWYPCQGLGMPPGNILKAIQEI